MKIENLTHEECGAILVSVGMVMQHHNLCALAAQDEDLKGARRHWIKSRLGPDVSDERVEYLLKVRLQYQLWKIGYLKEDRQEYRSSRSTRFGKAWRIVDEQGKDIVQPWSKTKKEAREIAKALNIQLEETCSTKPMASS